MSNFLEEKAYKYIIVDDDDIDRIALSHYLKDYRNLEHLASFSAPQNCLNFLKHNKVDILFLDVEMPGMNGLQLLSKVKDRIGCAILTTSHLEYASLGFEADALDYIVKPYNENRIRKCIQKVTSFLEMKHKANIFNKVVSDNTILVKEGRQQLYIQIYEIVYLKALKDYTRVITLNENKRLITIHCNLGKLLRENEDLKDFIRVHKSYAVNKRFIRSVSSQDIILQNDTKIPLGSNYKENIECIIK